MKKIFTIGDIHGNFKGLKQVLERGNFDYENDTLIQLGDVIDGLSESYECVEELLMIKNLIPIKGNHCYIFEEFFKTGVHNFNWDHGAIHTAWSYRENRDKNDVFNNILPKMVNIPKHHREFFINQKHFYIDEKNRLFIHGGFDRFKSIHKQDINSFLWDTKFWESAIKCDDNIKLTTIDCFSEIYIGHYSTINWTATGRFNHLKDENNPNDLQKITKPMYSGGVYNLDTGSGYKGGKLSMMNIDTKEIFQSDYIEELYPNEEGR